MSFAGTNSKNADLSKLDLAMEFLLKGSGPDEIRKNTGWFSGPDNKWRYEIDDSTAKLKKPFPEKGQLWRSVYDSVYIGMLKKHMDSDRGAIQLDDILDHQELFSAYPSLKNFSISIQDGKKSGIAMDSKTIYIGDEVVMHEVPSILLHEAQHAIQAIEGFPKGGSAKIDAWVCSEMRDLLITNTASEIKKMKPAPYEVFWGKEKTEAGELAYSGYLKEWHSDEYQKNLLIAAQQSAPIRVYALLYGEVEARNVQARRKMSIEDRLLKSPLETQDTADCDAIFYGMN